MTKQTKAYIALIFICIVWGTTFLAIRVGVMHYPAFLFAGIRQSVAGVILMTVALFLNRNMDLSAKNILRQMLIGFLMLTLGNGLVSWGEKFIPSGIAALICTLMPLFAVLFNLTSSKKDHFNSLIVSGLVLGVLGVGLIFRQNIADMANPVYLGGILATLFATSSWAMGSIVNKKHERPVNPFFNSGMQLFFGGLFMLMLSPVIDDYRGFQFWNTDALLALAYLIVFGSALAYAAYMYTLTALPIGIATIYAYINPLIAVAVGYLFLKEDINIFTGMAFLTIIVSVFMVNRGYRKQHKTAMKIADQDIAAAFPEAAPIES
jgi:drug/metabolite transporter (DMT)-like permease